MTLNKLVSCLGVVVGLSLMASPVTAQPTSEVPRTTWGAPDLQGVWDYRTLTPLARIIHEEADYSRKTNAPVWYNGCAHRPFATTEALA